MPQTAPELIEVLDRIGNELAALNGHIASIATQLEIANSEFPTKLGELNGNLEGIRIAILSLEETIITK